MIFWLVLKLGIMENIFEGFWFYLEYFLKIIIFAW
jgi:hypothetical protein